MAYKDLIRESYPQLLGTIDRAEGGNDSDLKLKSLKADIRAALDAIQANLEAGSISDGSVTTAKLAANAVTTAKITDANITTAKIADGNITAAKLAATAVTSAAIPAGGISDSADFSAGVVNTAALNDGAVTRVKIADGSVSFAKAKVFCSTEQTGNGLPLNIAHGLGGVPAMVFVTVTDTASAGDYDVTEGAHDGTNVIVTATDTVKFKVLAWL